MGQFKEVFSTSLQVCFCVGNNELGVWVQQHLYSCSVNTEEPVLKHTCGCFGVRAMLCVKEVNDADA